MKKNHQGFVGILLIIAVAVLVVGGVVMYSRNNSKVYSDLTDDTARKVIAEMQTPTTQNWKTYINTELGIEFKYPQDWQILKYSPRDQAVSLESKGGEMYMSFEISELKNQSNGKPMTIAEYTGIDLPENQPNDKYGLSKIMVDRRLSVKKSSSQIGTLIFVPVDSTQTLTIAGPSQSQPFDSIVASLKFTK